MRVSLRDNADAHRRTSADVGRSSAQVAAHRLKDSRSPKLLRGVEVVGSNPASLTAERQVRGSALIPVPPLGLCACTEGADCGLGPRPTRGNFVPWP